MGLGRRLLVARFTRRFGPVVLSVTGAAGHIHRELLAGDMTFSALEIAVHFVVECHPPPAWLRPYAEHNLGPHLADSGEVGSGVARGA
jgi:hypothetical protein